MTADVIPITRKADQTTHRKADLSDLWWQGTQASYRLYCLLWAIKRVD